MDSSWLRLREACVNAAKELADAYIALCDAEKAIEEACLRTPLIFYSRAKSVSNTGRVPMSSVYFAINGASRWAGMLGIRS
jgi:hypothetical protein